MITEKDLEQAIAECQGERSPNANTCIKLAAYYTIKNELFGMPSYSYAAPVETVENTIEYESDTDFSRAIAGRKAADVWPIMDELMSTVQTLMPRLYDGVMRKLQ